MLCLVLTAFSGCKRDHTPPTFSLVSPNAAISDSATTMIEISGQASDDSGLGEVTALLYSSDPAIYSAEGYTQSFAAQDLEGKSAGFSFAFQLGTPYYPSGKYVLAITVSDEDGVTSSNYFDVYLTEIPLRLIRPLYAVLQPGGDYHLLLHTPAGTAVDTATLGTDLTGFQVDNRNRTLVTSRSSGSFDTYRLADYGRDCQRTALPFGTSAPYTGLLCAKRSYYLSMDYAPFVMLIGPSCNLEAFLPDVTVKPTSSGAGRDDLYFGGTTTSGISKIDRYDIVTGGLKTTHVLGWEPIFSKPCGTHRILVAGNEGALGKLFVLDEKSLVSIHEMDVPGPILGVTASESAAWFINSAGVYGVDPETGTTTSLLHAGSFTCIEYDAASNHLFLGKVDGVGRITTSGAWVQDVTGINGVTSMITFVMNK